LEFHKTFESEQIILCVFNSYIKFTFYKCYKENGDVQGRGMIKRRGLEDMEGKRDGKHYRNDLEGKGVREDVEGKGRGMLREGGMGMGIGKGRGMGKGRGILREMDRQW
jgi:hypothetical protein